jgi:hypothetical protein
VFSTVMGNIFHLSQIRKVMIVPYTN